MDLSSRRVLLLFSLMAAALNIFPFLLTIPAGDAVMNYSQIECFSKHIWQGLFYPRWCMNSNGGMGSPAPIFYFPIPFYIAGLFYPLHHFGITFPEQYLIAIFFANAVAFAACVAWLRGISIRTEIAYLCAFIFLLFNYRTELLTRGSYAEYWCLSFLPLLFLYTRKLCEQPQQHWTTLALIIAWCLYCHAPVTFLALMGSGLFIVLYSRFNLRVVGWFTVSCLLAGMLSLPHYLPVRQLLPTLSDTIGGASYWQTSWVNSFVDDIPLNGEHGWAVIGFGVAMLASLCVGGAFLAKRGAIPNAAHRQEAQSWLIIMVFATVMMFSVSAPAWWPIELLSGIHTPWRMPSLIMLATTCLLAIMMQHVWQTRRTKTGDAVVLVLFFIISSLFYYGGVSPDSVELHKRHIKEQPIFAFFNTRETDSRFADYRSGYEPFFRDFVDRPNRKPVEWLQGAGEVKLEAWNEKGMVFSGVAKKPGTLRIEHFYYPIWQAQLNGKPVTIEPEPITGRMLVKIPTGAFTLSFTQHYWAIVTPLLHRVSMVSLLSGITIIGVGLLRCRRIVTKLS